MKEHWEGDEIFCTVWGFIALDILNKGHRFAKYGIPVTDDLLAAISRIILISLICGLFWGPAPKRVSKKLFWAMFLILSAITVIADFIM